MAYECFISVEFVERHTIDSHMWFIEGAPFVRVPEISILDLEDNIITALIISLFTDRRLPFAGDEPLTSGDRRGWWGDNTLAANDRIGSRLWTLARHKMITDFVVKEAEEILREALAWLEEDGVADEIFITITRPDNYTLVFEITIKKPDDDQLGKYTFAWRIAGNNVVA